MKWMTKARCADEPGFTELPEIDQLEYCAACRVVEPCREYGLRYATARNYVGAVFGGLTPYALHREKMRRERAA